MTHFHSLGSHSKLNLKHGRGNTIASKLLKAHCNDCKGLKQYKPIKRKNMGEVKSADRRCQKFEAGKQGITKEKEKAGT